MNPDDARLSETERVEAVGARLRTDMRQMQARGVTIIANAWGIEVAGSRIMFIDNQRRCCALGCFLLAEQARQPAFVRNQISHAPITLRDLERLAARHLDMTSIEIAALREGFDVAALDNTEHLTTSQRPWYVLGANLREEFVHGS